MIDSMNLFIAIFPYFFAIIAIALIPSKDKILNKQIKSFGAEKFIAVHMIAFIFVLVIGAYYIMSLFGDGSEDQYLNIFNGIFLITIAIGIMALNSRNYALFSKLEGDTGLKAQIVSPELGSEGAQEVEPVEPLKAIEDKPKYSKRTIEPEIVECPKCGNAIKVLARSRPVKISCPHCGIEGMIQ